TEEHASALEDAIVRGLGQNLLSIKSDNRNLARLCVDSPRWYRIISIRLESFLPRQWMDDACSGFSRESTYGCLDDSGLTTRIRGYRQQPVRINCAFEPI